MSEPPNPPGVVTMPRLRDPRSASPGARSARVRPVLLLCLALGLGACAPGGPTVVFGVAGPLSEGYGLSMQRGAELAMQEINAAGGIDGRMLQLRFRDDGASPERAIAVAEDFLADPEVVAVVGHVNSGAMMAAGTIYGRGLPAVATSATSPAVSRLGPWVFRVASNDSANAVVLARVVREMGKRTAVMYENDDYGRGLATSFRSALAQAGEGPLEMDPYLASTADFTPYLERLRRAEVEMIFLAGLEAGAARIIEQARALGMDSEFVGGDGVEGLVAMGPRFDGTRVGMLFHPEQSGAARLFADRFRSAHGQEPDSYAALGYDAVMLLARAAREGGPSRRAIRAALERVGATNGTPPFEGVAGTVAFDANGDPAGKAFAVGTVRAGRFVLEAVR